MKGRGILGYMCVDNVCYSYYIRGGGMCSISMRFHESADLQKRALI